MPLRSTPPAPASAGKDPIVTAVPRQAQPQLLVYPTGSHFLPSLPTIGDLTLAYPFTGLQETFQTPRNVQTLKTQLSSIICSPLSLKSSTRLPEGPVVHHPLTTHFTEKETQFQHFSDLPLRGQDALRETCPVQNTGLSWREEMEPV